MQRVYQDLPGQAHVVLVLGLATILNVELEQVSCTDFPSFPSEAFCDKRKPGEKNPGLGYLDLDCKSLALSKDDVF